MAKPNIQNITTSQTFQNWFDKTNELVAITRDSAITAQTGTADETSGNATLLGEFTANDLTATVKVATDDMESRTAGAPIEVASPMVITPPVDPIAATFLFGASGGRTRYTDGTDTAWDIGFDNSTDANFIMNQGAGGQFSLSPAGVLTVPSIVTNADVEIGSDLSIPGTLTANNIIVTNAVGDFNGTFQGDFTGDIYHPHPNGGNGAGKVLENGGPDRAIPASFYGNVNGTVSSLTNHDTDSLAEGDDNLYFTVARARDSLSQGVGVTYSKTTGVISIGQPVGTTNNVTFKNAGITENLNVGGDLDVTGTATADKFYGNGYNITGIKERARAFISFNGATGAVLASGGGLTLSKAGTGNYNINIPSSIIGGRPSTSNGYCIVIGNVNDKVLTRAPLQTIGNRQTSDTLTNYAAFVYSQTTSSFNIRATRAVLQYRDFGGNDHNDTATFGTAAVDPTLINVVILY